MAAVIPCFGRQGDLDLILADLAAIECGGMGGVDLRVVVVDNASEPVLRAPERARDAPVRVLRLEENLGGSGGYNAGMRAALDLDFADEGVGDEADEGVQRADFVWLVDSDARVARDTLANLVRAMRADPGIVVAGAAIADAATGRIFEVGGRICSRRGLFKPAARGAAGAEGPVECDYAAACCALVRASAIRRAGLMPDVFLNGDDTEWCIRLKRITGGRVVGVPDAVAAHPMFDKFQTWARYYHSRNCFGAIDALLLPRRVLFRRALHEVGRACSMAMMGRRDLADLHLAGLEDAADRDACGRAAQERLAFERFLPWDDVAARVRQNAPNARRIGLYDEAELPETVRERLEAQLERVGVAVERRCKSGLGGLAKRLLLGGPDEVAIVPARGRPGTWFAARVCLAATADGFLVQRPSRFGTAFSVVRAGLHGLRLAGRVALKRRRDRRIIPTVVGDQQAPALTLSVVILSYNRWPVLQGTIERLLKTPGVTAESIIVADNASADGTVDLLRDAWPQIRVLAQRENIGVDAFNRAVETAESDVVLILDDDAWPEPGTLKAAMELLVRREELGAVALHPVHPRTQESEWPFGRRLRGRTDDRWPVMGCGNLVRREVWRRVGGYERDFFLYRNDTDLAQKILALGLGVHFDPALVVWHDSPAAVIKSPRWHEFATRNWLWVCRRHGRGLSGVLAGAAGWAWAHRLAGRSPARHLRTLLGAAQGLGSPVPALDPGCCGSGEGIQRLLALRLRRASRPEA